MKMDGKGCNQVLLPWPPKVLSPNARAHWRARSKAAKDYRYICAMTAKLAGLAAPEGRLLLVIEFMPPNRARRDDDNLIAAFKSGRDGLADALKVDDSLFVTQCMLSDEVRPGGAVRVTFKPYQAQQ
jgi:crossover junction endodeoxyribonuclease RusA